MDADPFTRSTARALRRCTLSRRSLLECTALGATLAGPRLAHAVPATPVDDLPALVAGNTAFTLDLYAVLRQKADGNLLFSPLSISEALAMTYAGAGEDTATQIADALNFELPHPALSSAFGALNTDLVARGNAEDDPTNFVTGRALHIANGLWGEQSYPFSTSYSAELAQSFGAGLQPTDFKRAPEDARQEINSWVADQTNDLIENIVPPGAIASVTRLVLANAIYFRSAWSHQFYPGNTENGDFHRLDGTTATVPFMFQQTYFGYARGEGFQFVEFPYAGDMSSSSGFAFLVILPDEGRFDAVEEGLTPETLGAAIEQLEYTEIVVYLPKFTFDFDADLNGPLQSLGMTDAFSERADFTGMVEGIPPEPLSISKVLHKAFIGVDEDGTQAGAATVVLGAGAAPPAEVPPEVRIDRPFLFAIRDTQTGTLLFLGRVMDPSA